MEAGEYVSGSARAGAGASGGWKRVQVQVLGLRLAGPGPGRACAMERQVPGLGQAELSRRNRQRRKEFARQAPGSAQRGRRQKHENRNLRGHSGWNLGCAGGGSVGNLTTPT